MCWELMLGAGEEDDAAMAEGMGLFVIDAVLPEREGVAERRARHSERSRRRSRT